MEFGRPNVDEVDVFAHFPDPSEVQNISARLASTNGKLKDDPDEAGWQNMGTSAEDVHLSMSELRPGDLVEIS